LYSRLM